MGGGSNVEGESIACQLHFRSAQGGLELRDVSNSFWKGTRRVKTRLKEVTLLLSQLVSQNKMCTFTCSCIVLSASFQKFKLCIMNIGKTGCRFQLCHPFLLIILLNKVVVMSQMSLYIAWGMTAIPRYHYRGYQ